MAQAIHLHQVSPLKASCQQCSLSNLCLPLAVEENDLERLEDIVQQGKIYNRGEHIFDQSTPMRSCFAVKSGSVKTSIITEGGDEQVTGFFMPGELVGLDVDDARFNTHDKRCEDNRIEMLAVLEEIFRAQPGAHWKAELDRKQLPADVIEKYAFPASDPAARDNRYIVEIDQPGGDSIASLGFPVHMAAHPAEIRRRAPKPGEHTDEIIREFLGGEQPS